MHQNKFRGTGIAIATPFTKDESVDYRSLTGLVNHIANNRVEYVVALGTTGETPTLSGDEKKAVVDHVRKVLDKRIPLVIGIGGNNTREILSAIESTDFHDIDGLLSVSPYYNKPSQKGIYMHYKAIAACSPVPVIIYNVPGRTGTNVSADTLIRLSHEVENLAGVKEASGDMNQIMEVINKKEKNFLVISGDDALALPMISVGASGVISVIGNAFPRQLSEMIRLSLDGRFDEARLIHYSLLEIIKTIFIDGNPAGVKACLSILNIAENHLRMPLTPVSRQTYHRLSELISSIPIYP